MPTKPAITSTGILGAALVLVSTGLTLAGIEYDAATLNATLNDVATLAGGALALYGRWRASAAITGLFRAQ